MFQMKRSKHLRKSKGVGLNMVWEWFKLIITFSLAIVLLFIMMVCVDMINYGKREYSYNVVETELRDLQSTSPEVYLNIKKEELERRKKEIKADLKEREQSFSYNVFTNVNAFVKKMRNR